jgi:hypothetical protein
MRTLSNIGTLVTVAELNRFVYTGGRARGYGSPVATYMRCYMLRYPVGERDMPLAV